MQILFSSMKKSTEGSLLVKLQSKAKGKNVKKKKNTSKNESGWVFFRQKLIIVFSLDW